MSEMLPAVRFDNKDAVEADWRADKVSAFDPDDDELAETPADVVAMLGFDPLELAEKRAPAMPVAEPCGEFLRAEIDGRVVYLEHALVKRKLPKGIWTTLEPLPFDRAATRAAVNGMADLWSGVFARQVKHAARKVSALKFERPDDVQKFEA